MKREYFGEPSETIPFACRVGLHSWCHQGGFDTFDFCNYCSIVRRP